MLELICQGRPHLIEPMIFRLAMRSGLLTAGVTGWPVSAHYRILRIARPSQGEAAQVPLAVIELAEIPGERTVLAIGPVGEPNVEAGQELERYAQALVQELARFEFLALPDTPKEPIGFHLQKSDRLAGARLLETFDAVNSVEIGPTRPALSEPAARE